MNIETLQAILEIGQSVTLIGFMLISLKYVDALRLEQKDRADDRTSDIINDWKRIRDLD